MDTKVLWILRNSGRKIEDAETLEELKNRLVTEPELSHVFRDMNRVPIAEPEPNPEPIPESKPIK